MIFEYGLLVFEYRVSVFESGLYIFKYRMTVFEYEVAGTLV